MFTPTGPDPQSPTCPNLELRELYLLTRNPGLSGNITHGSLDIRLSFTTPPFISKKPPPLYKKSRWMESYCQHPSFATSAFENHPITHISSTHMSMLSHHSSPTHLNVS